MTQPDMFASPHRDETIREAVPSTNHDDPIDHTTVTVSSSNQPQVCLGEAIEEDMRVEHAASDYRLWITRSAAAHAGFEVFRKVGDHPAWALRDALPEEVQLRYSIGDAKPGMDAEALKMMLDGRIVPMREMDEPVSDQDEWLEFLCGIAADITHEDDQVVFARMVSKVGEAEGTQKVSVKEEGKKPVG